MENATRALLMAGGVLIAIIIITLLIKTYGNIGVFQKQQISAEEAERIEEFNKDYTKYEGQYVYGTEVVTVINRVANYQRNTDAAFTIDIFFLDPYTYTLSNGKTKTTKGKLTLKGDEETKYSFINRDDENLEELKDRVFKCDNINYDDSGKVNYIKFTEKKIE